MEFGEFRDVLLATPRVQENLVVLEHTDSTNRAGRRVVTELQRDFSPLRPTLLVAWTQSEGRGRRGRSWQSPAGRGVYATLALDVERDKVAALPMLVGCELAETLSRHTRQPTRLKWPNDLLVGERKLGGVLIETISEDDDALAALIGFGVNHDLTEAELPIARSTSLRLECDLLPELPGLIVELANRIQLGIEVIGSIDGVVARYRSHCRHRPGEPLSFRLGDQAIEGRFVDLDEHGWLVLDTAEGRRTFAAGEIVERHDDVVAGAGDG